MNTAGKLGLFGLGLGLVLGAGWAVGSAVGPLGSDEPPAGHDAAGHGKAEQGQGGEHGGDHGKPSAQQLPGLASSQGGYTFAPAAAKLPAGDRTRFAFRILGPDGRPVTKFDVEHEKRMHLIVVRRDTAGFQHVHPTLADDGTWSVPLRLDRPGTYRAFADFAPTGGEPLTLGVDLDVPGEYRPTKYRASRQDEVDGYTVRLAGELTAGKTSAVRLTVTRDGKPVELEPYLGANGHLVALREGDLAYLHVHPEHGHANEVEFAAEVPSSGRYRLFLDFKHRGEVRTADFTVEAS